MVKYVDRAAPDQQIRNTAAGCCVVDLKRLRILGTADFLGTTTGRPLNVPD